METVEREPDDLYKAISLIMEDAPSIQKLGQMQGYSYDRFEDLLAVIKPLLLEHGLIVVPCKKLLLSSEQYTGISGYESRLVRVHTTFRLIHIATGMSLETEQISEAADEGDKAIAKARTAALKAMLKETFLVMSHEPDPDDTPSERFREINHSPNYLMLLGSIKGEKIKARRDKTMQVAKTFLDEGQITKDEFDELATAAEL